MLDDTAFKDGVRSDHHPFSHTSEDASACSRSHCYAFRWLYRALLCGCWSSNLPKFLEQEHKSSEHAPQEEVKGIQVR